MFGRSTYERSASNIAEHFRGIQSELTKIGSQASRRAANGASAGADQVKEVIAAASPVLDDLAGLLGRSQTYAVNRAAEFGGRALSRSSDAAGRMVAQAKDQPAIMLAVALGIGVLIGMASQRIVAK